MNGSQGMVHLTRQVCKRRLSEINGQHYNSVLSAVQEWLAAFDLFNTLNLLQWPKGFEQSNLRHYSVSNRLDFLDV